MLEIKFDVTTLSAEQRQDLASFILGFPGKISEPLTGVGNIEAHDFSPEAPPLPEGASAAPISAGAEVYLIAPEVIPETTSSNPIVNIPPVPQSENAAMTAAPQQANPVELDSEGLPWDNRIHSSSRGKIANGTWKLMRGSDPAIVETVKAELRALMDINTTHSPETRIPAPPAPSSDLSGNAVPTPPAAASHYLMTPIRHSFVDFIEDITKLLVSKKLAQPEIIKVCNDAGVAAPNLLAARQDLIPQVAKALDTIVASRI